MDTNRIIFNELRNTIKYEQDNFLNKLDLLKNKVKDYFGEDSLIFYDFKNNSLDISLEELEKQLNDDCDLIVKEKVIKNVNNNIKTPGRYL